MLLRAEYLPGIVAVAAAMVVAGVTRSNRTPKSMRRRRSATPSPSEEELSQARARSILGVPEDAGPDEIQAAYMRLMRMAHPDAGGSAGLAAELNAARDKLLKKT